jgi:hypothetical protein
MFDIPLGAQLMLVANPEYGFELLPNQGFTPTGWGGGVRYMSASAANGINVGFIKLPSDPGGGGSGGGSGCPNGEIIC